MTLNSEGLEKAYKAAEQIGGEWISLQPNVVEHVIEAYLSALPPVDGLEVVAELKRIVAEEAADFADAAGHAIEAGERPDLWDREVEVAVHTLSQALLSAYERGRAERASEPIHEAVIDRYVRMLPFAITPACEPDPGTSNAHLLWMLEQLRTMTDRAKAMRWLGFIQGIMIGKRGYTTVSAERNFTRLYFAPPAEENDNER